ncbi:MAG: 23S rRNA pseudouridine(1911/1915/1917) synthase RluD [Buchnera aphidicola (Nurudea shiraii)]
MVNIKILRVVVPTMLKSNMRLDKVLAKLFFEYSRTCLKKWILNNQVNINGKVFSKPNTKVLFGDEITIKIIHNSYLNSLKYPQKIPLNIIYEDNDILVINKQANLVVHPGAGHKDGTLLNALLYQNHNFLSIPRAGIIHRLDKNTTGLMVIAKNVLSYNNLAKSMKSRKIVRKYEALVYGRVISGGSVFASIKRHPFRRTIMTTGVVGKKAITHYRIIKRFSCYTHLMIQLETGRTHQIRVHMLSINYPIIGDREYGNKYKFSRNMVASVHKVVKAFPRQALHASELCLKHPTTNLWMKWNSPIPKDMLDLLSHLNLYNT